MMALLPFLRMGWTFIKPFWKYIAGVLFAVVIVWAVHHWYEGKLDTAYNAGIAAAQAADAKVVAAQKVVNDQIVTDLKVSAAQKQAELEGKLHENEIVADDLRAQLRAHRVCTDERSGLAVSGNPEPAVESDGAAGHDGPAEPTQEDTIGFDTETVGDDLVTIGEACQSNTDKLVTLQGYVNELLAKLKLAAQASRQAAPVSVRTR